MGMTAVNRIHKTFVYILLIVLAIICMLPFYWLVRSSLMTQAAIFRLPPIWIPNPPRWQNYTTALTMLPFATYFRNTMTIVFFTVTGTVITSSICAFGFARCRWPGRDIVFGILMSSMMLPFIVTLIPTFIGWRALGFLNTFVPLTVPAWFGGGMFNVFLLRQFYSTIPKELDEAAVVDGASYFKIYWRIILPLTRPALIVVGLFSFLHAWNDFLGPLVYLTNDRMFTLALGLRQFQGLYNAQWHFMMAASTVMLIPVIIVFLLGQKYFIEGIALTGLKG